MNLKEGGGKAGQNLSESSGGKERGIKYGKFDQYLMETSTEALENELIPQLEAIADFFGNAPFSLGTTDGGSKIDDIDRNEEHEDIDSPDEESELEIGEGVADD